jgi:hypothetical protein
VPKLQVAWKPKIRPEQKRSKNLLRVRHIPPSTCPVCLGARLTWNHPGETVSIQRQNSEGMLVSFRKHVRASRRSGDLGQVATCYRLLS